MKISIPKDYRQAFQLSIRIAKLVEHGKFATAFDLIPFSEEAKASSIIWGTDLAQRREILQRCENILSIAGFKPDEKKMAILDTLEAQIADATSPVNVLTVSDQEADILVAALETYTRLCLGQVDQPLHDFSLLPKPGIREQDREVINDMRHMAITTGGASFGITNNLLPDDVRNGWHAKKVIDHHLAHKRQPTGGVTLRFDSPMRIGSCSAQDITIEDPEFDLNFKSAGGTISPSF